MAENTGERKNAKQDNSVEQQVQSLPQVPLPIQQPSIQQLAAPVPQVQIPQEKLERLQQLLTELVIASTDLGLALASLECDKANECPVVQSAKSIAKALREIRKITK
ncbi:MAG: hypothetical protein ACP5IE_10355 [Infirmifilum sp.]